MFIVVDKKKRKRNLKSETAQNALQNFTASLPDATELTTTTDGRQSAHAVSSKPKSGTVKKTSKSKSSNAVCNVLVKSAGYRDALQITLNALKESGFSPENANQILRDLGVSVP